MTTISETAEDLIAGRLVVPLKEVAPLVSYDVDSAAMYDAIRRGAFPLRVVQLKGAGGSTGRKYYVTADEIRRFAAGLERDLEPVA